MSILSKIQFPTFNVFVFFVCFYFRFLYFFKQKYVTTCDGSKSKAKSRFYLKKLIALSYKQYEGSEISSTYLRAFVCLFCQP